MQYTSVYFFFLPEIKFTVNVLQTSTDTAMLVMLSACKDFSHCHCRKNRFFPTSFTPLPHVSVLHFGNANSPISSIHLLLSLPWLLLHFPGCHFYSLSIYCHMRDNKWKIVCVGNRSTTQLDFSSKRINI